MPYKDNNKIICMRRMRIGIVGGTGAMGCGFALRWCKKHDILIGSRDAARASAAATKYLKDAKTAFGDTKTITGASNEEIASKSDILVLSIPYENIDAVCSSLLSLVPESCIVISPIVPMEKTSVGFEFIPIRDSKKTAHASVAAHMKNPARLVSAFHVISEKKLANLASTLDYDIFVCGDDKDAVDTVCTLIAEIAGLRALRIGGGSLAYMVEVATPMLLNAMIRNKLPSPGIKIV